MHCHSGSPIAAAADHPPAELNRAPGDSHSILPPLASSRSPATVWAALPFAKQLDERIPGRMPVGLGAVIVMPGLVALVMMIGVVMVMLGRAEPARQRDPALETVAGLRVLGALAGSL